MLFLLAVFFGITTSSHIEPLVTTKNGKVLGSRFKSERDSFSYYGFQGIPYAEAPIGERRFMPPQRKRSWTSILNATKDIPACMQPLSIRYGLTTSEDCLVLNVYTPNPNGSFPVMVYIYGGGFISGSATKKIYNPDFLITENVVLVVPNYRLGIFGFLSTQDDVAPGNNGLKDQIMALEWVKTNIAAFGGNPDKVTIFGESAGAASVSILLQAEKAKGLFHAAIMESGVSLSSFSRTRNPLENARKTATLLNIEANNNKELVTKLKGVSAEQLLDAQNKIISENTKHGIRFEFSFTPTIEPPHDGAVLTEYSYDALKRGRFLRLPIMLGYNSAEGNYFIGSTFTTGNYLNNTVLVTKSLKVNRSQEAEVGDEIKSYYFGNRSIASSPIQLSKFITEDQFIRPTLGLVQVVSSVIPTYLYEFSYVGSPAVGRRDLPGVGHAEDVRYLWNTGTFLNKNDSVTSKKLVKLWTNFAKYSNPTPSETQLFDNTIWMQSNKENLTFLHIDKTLHMKADPRKKEMDFWTTIFAKYGNPPHDTI